MTAQTASVYRCAKHPEKLQYRTSAEAFDVAERRAPAEGVPIYVYACDHCGYFHLSKKNGTENVGRRMATRRDGRIWETHTQQPAAAVRDVRYLAGHPSVMEAEQALRQALKQHGNPTALSVREAMEWTGLSNYRAVTTLERMGWLPDGATRSRRWTHPAH